MLSTVPGPRGPRPPDAAPGHAPERIARFYEEALGWTVLRDRPGGPGLLATGVAFDALELPARGGGAAVARREAAAHRAGPSLPVTGPVALSADRSRMWLLLAPGSAEEVPGL